jgi:nucleotide-binding universal stress UspA family protein
VRWNKILVAIDFSEPSREAFRVAMTMAADGGSALVLVHVLRPPPGGYAVGLELGPVGEDILQGLLRDATRGLDELRREAEAAGVSLVSTSVRTGSPWHEITELLRQDPAFDLAVLGTHGRTGIKHVLIGSVAEKVVRHAPCPVLVVRRREVDGY